MDNSAVPAGAGAGDRRIVIVIGPGRSGTSTVAGALTKSGLEVPGKPIAGNPTNPSGFFEPRWVVDFHKALLKGNYVATMDSSPTVQERMKKVASEPAVRETLRSWLEERLREQPQLVVKDPRTIWFSDLWSETARELGVETGFLTMLRHPAEVSASRAKYYNKNDESHGRAVEIRHIAGWVNVVLTAEQVTAGSPRTFVRYADLLSDWRSALSQIGRDLHLDFFPTLDASEHPVDQFIEPSLRRLHRDWENVDVPAPLRDLGERLWRAMVVMSAEGESETLSHELEAIRDDYRQMTADALALSQSVVRRARLSSRRQERRRLLEEGYALPTETKEGTLDRARSVIRQLVRPST